jgi:O-methyltransferase/aklanonic acid methyltransferase
MFNRAAASYERVGPPFFSHFGRRLVDALALAEGARVLDVACGVGAVLLAAAQRVGTSGLVVGVDCAEAMVDRARYEILSRVVPNALLVRMNATTLAFPDSVFDAVLCGFALNGLSTPTLALQEFSRVMRAQGLFGVTVSEGWWWEGDERWQWHSDLVQSLGIRVDYRPRQFTKADDLGAALTKQGFGHVSVVLESYDLVFADADEWWRWAWSHGYREVLEGMSPSQLERYRVVCFEHLRDCPAHGRLQVFIASATKNNK